MKYLVFLTIIGLGLSVRAPQPTNSELEGQIMAQLTTTGLNLITQHEGLRLQSYQDAGGVWTIGYGHTGADVAPNQTITNLQALQYLQADLKSTEAALDTLITAPVNANQYAALVSLAYNIGIGNFAKSTLLKKLNQGNYSAAAQEFLKWDHVDGQVLLGLRTRRLAEQAIFVDAINNGGAA